MRKTYVDPYVDDWCEHDEIESRCSLPHEPQPEPARHADVAHALWLIGALPMSGTQADKLASGLLSSFDIYHKPEGADHG